MPRFTLMDLFKEKHEIECYKDDPDLGSAVQSNNPWQEYGKCSEVMHWRS